MSKTTYDFTVDSIVSVAPIVIDPETLTPSKIKLIERINENDVTLIFDTTFKRNWCGDEDQNYEQ